MTEKIIYLSETYGILYSEAKTFIEEFGFEEAENICKKHVAFEARLDKESKEAYKNAMNELRDFERDHPTHISRGWGGQVKRWVR